MTEKSYLWTTGGAGDGASTYTRVETSIFCRVLAASGGFEGVSPGLLNNLTGSVIGANTAQINTGGAVVDGKPYQNDAALNVNIPSAVGGGNTRIDRIVLRADWTAQTVRITRIAGVDSPAPTPPAITQTPGTTYDIKLYKALVNTTGTVTLTDERIFASGVPLRQGGGSDDWSTGGSTNYMTPGIRIQVGSALLPMAGTSSSKTTVTFPVPFSNVPLVVVSLFTTNTGVIRIASSVASPSATGFDAVLYSTDGTNDAVGHYIFWMAIGPQ